jgi:hypothetical protein
MDEDGGILLIILGLFLLYLYNTGRLAAVIGVLKNPNYVLEPTVPGGTGTASTPSTSSSSSSGSGGLGNILGDVLGGIGGFFGF